MKKILIATGNAHKVKEFEDIANANNLDVLFVCPRDFNDFDEPYENGNSYRENAYIKAKYYYDKYHLPTIADDSGIEIAFYDNKPGIYSSRWKNGMPYEERNKLICEEMKDSLDRSASFYSCIAYIENDVCKYYEGVLKGNIAFNPSGKEGFGYDPIFVPLGYYKTNAELGEDFKKEFSHRSIALRKWAEDFENK